METVEQAYSELGETWCRENNHHCNPKLFNNYLASDIMVNDETDSLAFVISFSSEFSLDLSDETRAVYVYRDVHSSDHLDFRETSEDELYQILGEFELNQLLEEENLELIFSRVDFIED